MIRTLVGLLPKGSEGSVGKHVFFTLLGLVLRAVGVVLLVPLVAALFSGTPSNAWPWVGWLALVTVAGWVVDYLVARIGYDLGFSLLGRGQKTVGAHVEKTRLNWFTPENTSVARQSIAATGPDLVGVVVYLVTPVVTAILLPLVIALALFAVSWQLALVALLGVPVLFGAYVVSGMLGRKADREADSANAQLTERIVEFAGTQQALRASRRVDSEHSHVGTALKTQHNAMMKLLFMQIPGHLIFGLASQLMLILMAGMTVYLTVQGNVSVPEAIALIVVTVRYLEPFTVLAELSAGVENSITMLRKLRTVLDAPVVSDAAPGGADIRFDRVSFTYGDNDVLHELTFALEPNTTTAIVGPSGSGKSTVLSLIAGLQEPTSGIVSAGESSVVFQEPYLFDGPIRDNILSGNPDATDDQLHDAITAARAEGFASKPNSSMLSGGQRQRVSIARALLKPAPILLVDEATSARDNENEAAITTALQNSDRTRVIVAHRLSSIRQADRVLFLEDGRIIEDGSVDELLAADGRFAEFWRQQDQAAGWDLGR